MKTFLAIILFISFSVFFGMTHLNHKNSQLIKINPCPSNHEKAEADLKGYLAKERSVEDLREKYGLSIDHTAQNKIYSLQSELNQIECKKLIENNSKWLENAANYSIYKVGRSYFIVTYSLTEKEEFDRNSIVVVDDTYEAVAIVIDFDTSNRGDR